MGYTKIMNVSIQLRCAIRAWNILVRCKEVDWKSMWSLGVHLLAENNLDNASERQSSKVDFLRLMMLQRPEDREMILKELVLRLILCERYREALEDLELYLPSFPYQDNATLHIYAGMVSLYLAQPKAAGLEPNTKLLREAHTYFERAMTLERDNSIAQGCMHLVKTMNTADSHLAESDDETLVHRAQERDYAPKRKRVRVTTG
ncbi:hypothetical protein MKEN_00092100 [Mycena kentingensis (nom. inval.)]|nr:hypothetical protein MKEN_00092100 [Mycena kentingensis (nom. inval.)]